MEKLYVYVSGPLHSSGRAQINVRNACLEAEQLLEGNTDIVPIVPHLMMYWDAMTPHDAEYWLHIDKGLLLGCGAVLRIKGESVGGDMEVGWAKDAGIPVYYSAGAIVMAYEKGLFEKKEAVGVVMGKAAHMTLTATAEVEEGPMVTTASGAEKPALPPFKYKVDQQVKSLSGRGGFGVGRIKGTRHEAGVPYYNCTFGAFTGWVPEGDIDPIIMGADISEGGDLAVITVMQKQGDGYVQVKMSLAEGDECMLAANPYRSEQRVRLTKIESGDRLRVEGLEDGKIYVVTSHELRPIPDDDDTTGVAGGDGA